VRLDANHNPVPRDDLSWLKDIQCQISNWDGSIASLSLDDMKNWDRFYGYLKYFQDPGDFDYEKNQGDLDHILENTRGKPNKEYSLAGLFTLDELNTVLPQIIKKNKLIYISSHNHVIGLFYSDNEYRFYDPNAKGIVSHIDISTLSNAIFKSFRYDPSRASP